MIELRVIGTPAGQGNHRASRSGYIYETTKGHKPWRDSIIWAARENGGKISGPAVMDLIFTVIKPKSAPKRRVIYPDRRPDLDKCIRSVFDALKMAGTIEDDARIISCWARKVFPGEDADALDVPGCVIRLESPIV